MGSGYIIKLVRILRKTFFTIILLFYVTPSVLVGQFWISGSLGGTTVGPPISPGLSVAGTYQTGNYPITVRSVWTEAVGSSFTTAKESLTELAVLVGYQIPETSSIFNIGLSKINGWHRGKFISSGFLGSEYEINKYETIGIVFEINTIKTFGSFFGVGFGFSGNLNKEMTFFSALLSLNLGKMGD